MSTSAISLSVRNTPSFCCPSADRMMAITCGALAVISRLWAHESSAGSSVANPIFYGSVAALSVLATQQVWRFRQNLATYTAVCKALEEGGVETIPHLSKRIQLLSKKDVLQILEKATRKNHGTLIRLMLHHAEPLLDQELGYFAQLACGMTHKEAVQALIQSQMPSEPYMRVVLPWVAAQGEEASVDVFLKHPDRIPDIALGESIHAAAQNGHTFVVARLMAYGYALWRHTGIHSDLARLLGLAVEQAALHGHVYVLDAIFLNFEAERGIVLQEAAVAAANVGRSDTLRFLLEKKRYREKIRWTEVISRAVERGQLETLQFLIDHQRGYSNANLEYLMCVAADYKQVEVLDYLLGRVHDLLSIRTRNILILCLSRQGQSRLIERLLQGGPIYEDTRDAAITQANMRNRHQLVDVLNMARIAQREDLDDEYSALALTFDEVRRQPLLFLDSCAQQFPSRIYLKDAQKTLDLSGITKQFVETLAQAVSPMVVLDGHHPPEKLRIFTLLASFLSALIEKNERRSDKLVTGPLLPLFFYQDVKSILISDRESTAKKKIAERLCAAEPHQYALLLNYLTSATDKNRQAFAAFMGINPDQADLEASHIINQYLAPAKAFAKGLSDRFKDLLLQDPISIAHLLQGEDDVAADKLIHSLVQEGNSPLLTEQISWVCEMIYTYDASFRKRFLRAVTGNSYFKDDLKITIQSSWRGVFEMHTCFNTLDLPAHVMTKEAFMEALSACLDDKYNTA